MTLIQITNDYTTTQNNATHVFKVGEKYEVIVPLGGDYVDAIKTKGNEVVYVKIPNGYWQYTASMIDTPASGVGITQNTSTQFSKAETNTKYITLGIVVIGLVSMALIKQ